MKPVCVYQALVKAAFGFRCFQSGDPRIHANLEKSINHMNKTSSILVIASSIVLFAPCLASADTIPTGTPLTVRTTNAMSSRDLAGRKFYGTLAQAVRVKGAVVVPAGTHVVGVVQSPQVRIASSTRPFTLRLTDVSLGHRTVPIKTAPLETKDTSPWLTARRGVQVTGSAFLLPAGTIMQFQLSQPVNL